MDLDWERARNRILSTQDFEEKERLVQIIDSCYVDFGEIDTDLAARLILMNGWHR